MNERIEELIVLYLHRGSSPEEERELFEVCKTHPEAANLLRQHIILSLKLRQLRDKTQVSPEVRNRLLSRINEIPPMSEPKTEPIIVGLGSRYRFGWMHVSGAALTGATAVLLFLLFATPPAGGPSESTLAVSTPVRDTVLVSRADTVTEFQHVTRPVYITRKSSPPNVEDATRGGFSGSMESANPSVKKDVETGVRSSNPLSAPFADPDARGASAFTESRKPTYLEQYHAMVLHLEKVRISDNDRIRN